MVTTVPAGVVRGTLLLALVLVLLNSVLRNAAHDSTTDGPEDTVVGLVAREATGETAGKGSTESTLALLGTAGSLLLVTSVLVVGFLATVLAVRGLAILLLAVLLLAAIVIVGAAAATAVVVVGASATVVVLAVALLLVVLLLSVALVVAALRGVATLLVLSVALVLAVATVATLVVLVVAGHV